MVRLPDGTTARLVHWSTPGLQRGRGRRARVELPSGARRTVAQDAVALLCARDGYAPDGCQGTVPARLARWRLCTGCAAELGMAARSDEETAP